MQHLYTLFFFLPAFSLALGGPAYRMEEESSVLQLQIRNKLILVEGQVNGQSGYFLFDTGASELILNKAYFPLHEGYNPGFYYTDVNGNRDFYGYTHVRQFGWGGLQGEDFFAPRISLSALEASLQERVLGIIGYDVLRHVDLEVDYYRNTLTLYRPVMGSMSGGPAGPDYSLGFQMDGHLPILRAKLGEAEGLRLALDSGSSINICARRLKPKLRKKALQKRTLSLQGAAGRLEDTPCYVMESLQIAGAYSIAPCLVALGSLDSLKNHGFRIDGLLGVNFFRLGRILLSYRAQRIAVWLGENDYTMRHREIK